MEYPGSDIPIGNSNASTDRVTLRLGFQVKAIENFFICLKSKQNKTNYWNLVQLDLEKLDKTWFVI